MYRKAESYRFPPIVFLQIETDEAQPLRLAVCECARIPNVWPQHASGWWQLAGLFRLQPRARGLHFRSLLARTGAVWFTTLWHVVAADDWR